MKKSIILISLVLIISLLLVGCSQKEKVVDPHALSNASTAVKEKNNFNIEEKTGILKDTISMDKEGMFKSTITKTKSSQTAQVEFEYYFNDSTEVSEFMGKTIFMTPMLVNTLCKSFPVMFFDTDFSSLNEEMNKATGQANNIKDQSSLELIETLKGYTVDDVKITFLDFETNEKIAECSATSKTNIKFTAYKEYDPESSFLNAKIGVLD